MNYGVQINKKASPILTLTMNNSYNQLFKRNIRIETRAEKFPLN